MNTLKKQIAENSILIEEIDKFIGTFSEKKSYLRNYWLNKREIKEQAKEHNAKLDEIAKFITKYISGRKKG